MALHGQAESIAVSRDMRTHSIPDKNVLQFYWQIQWNRVGILSDCHLLIICLSITVF